jgi:hypothetical protein
MIAKLVGCGIAILALLAIGCEDSRRASPEPANTDTPTQVAITPESQPPENPILLPQFRSEAAREAFDKFYPRSLQSELEADLPDLNPTFPNPCGCDDEFRFGDVAVGAAGFPSHWIRHWATLLNSPDGDKAFKWLLAKPNTPKSSQLYALCGLYWTDRKAFAAALPRFERDESIVEHGLGCMGFRKKVRHLVRPPDTLASRIGLGGPIEEIAGRFLDASRSWGFGGMSRESTPEWITQKKEPE